MNATKGTAIDIDLGHSFRNLVVPKIFVNFDTTGFMILRHHVHQKIEMSDYIEIHCQ